MTLPDFITNLPIADIPNEDILGHMIPSDERLAVFMQFVNDTVIPAHSHGDQWGIVISGTVDMTADGITNTYKKGDSYFIPGGIVHSAVIPEGTVILEIFADTDRFAPKSS